jgi:Bacteriophage head to tail connecting protein
VAEPIDTFERRAASIRGKRQAILPFWQELAEQFHPFRAQFTRQHYLSEQFMDIQLTSYPMIVSRELQNSFAAMLRPRDQEWFAATIDRPERLDRQGKAWLEWATAVQRRAMYDPKSMFTRATKEGDQDFAVFGQTALTRETDHANTRMLYRAWHLKDTLWAEQEDGSIGEVYRYWKPTGAKLKQRFPKTASKKIDNWVDKDPHREVDCMHIVIPGEDYDRVPMPGEDKPAKFRTPWVSIYVDVENKEVLEEVGSYSRIYTIPRWQTVSGSQWAYSPAAVAGLPDARFLQAMTLTLMEAGEVTVRPPLVATKEAIRSDVALYSGGITWVDAEYDERLGEAIRPLLTTQPTGLNAGMEMMKDAREKLAAAFYLNKLALPAPDREMTAYETGQRIQEWIRSALPLFEPVEAEYNAALCEDTFEALMREGAFGAYGSIPPSLRGQEVKFTFESPLHQATKRKKGPLLLQAAQLIGAAAQLDPSAAFEVDAAAALRDALEGIDVPETWMRDPEQAAELAQEQQQQQATALRTQQIQNAGSAAQSLGEAVKTFQGGAQ